MIKKLLYTFFFGYAAFKWRRLIRTLIIILTFGSLLFWWINALYVAIENYNPAKGDLIILGKAHFIFNSVLQFFGLALAGSAFFIGVYIVIGLISWLIKPFIVKENQT